MNKTRIPMVDLHSQYISIKGEIDDAIASVIGRSSFIRGDDVDLFEENFAKLLDVEYCVSCANGTDAIFVALKALGVEPGDEVIVPAHTWISTSETVSQAGAEIVFCDTEKEFYTIDPAKVESLITPKTKGIIPVHLYGQPADMDAIMQIAEKHDLWVIEDCAQAHLAEYKGTKVGTIGDIGTFSFYPGKNLGAMGDAGGLVTSDRKLMEFCTNYARHGGKGVHVMEGINSRMDGIQGAVLNVKMQYLEEWTQARIAIAERYSEMLENYNIDLPSRRDNTSHVFHLYVVQLNDRDGVRDKLLKEDVSTSINYEEALPFYPAYSHMKHKQEDFPVAFCSSRRILSLPMYPELKEAAQDRVITVLREVC